MADSVLIIWGSNVRAQRLKLRPDGMRRQDVSDPAMSQSDLANLLEPPVRQSTVARWEAGKTEPRRDHKAQLARILGAETSMLFPMVGVAS